jgi:hypothetical protein
MNTNIRKEEREAIAAANSYMGVRAISLYSQGKLTSAIYATAPAKASAQPQKFEKSLVVCSPLSI